ncbi:MAG TPA: V-type ATPase 116kDa subunit family protein [Gemmatimonadales bacterium]|nr:V-type ATPase 116kDa subunit family protein [Gemmatimonadales bacterium]
MIIAMSKLRILGPRERLEDVLRVLQDLSLLHLSAPEAVPLQHPELSPEQERERRHLQVALENVEHALTALEIRDGGSAAPAPAATRADLVRWARLGWRVRRETERLAARVAALEEERALIMKYQHFFSAFRALLESESRWPNATAYHVLLRGSEAGTLPQLRASLAAVIGEEFQVFSQPLPTGEVAVLIVVSAQAAGRVERLLAEARVQEIPVPEAFGGKSLTVAIPRMLERLGQIPGDVEEVKRRRQAMARAHGADLRHARAALHDRLQALAALPLSAVTARAFVLEGWVPTRARTDLEHGLQAAFGDDVVVSEVAEEEWESEQAPVVLSNPRLLRPFETVVGLMPLPRYGSIDPTPFVAVFFPAFFGLMVGDVGYGLVLAAVGLLLHRRSRPRTTLRNVSEIIGPCALSAILAGFLFGELFGDLGRRWLGLHPLLFDREDALVPFLLLAVAVGAVHVLLGMVLGVVSARRHPRQAMGRGVSAAMVVLVILALLAAVGVLPRGFFSPVVIALLVAFPVLIALEGLVAPIELLATLGNILSYARIMALGVASVMMAVVANQMVGAIGSVAVGIMFALLFHLVNFAIAAFSPTIHALRLHYVEFFGKFFSPGGVRYQPFGHWTRATARARPTPRHPRQTA